MDVYLKIDCFHGESNVRHRKGCGIIEPVGFWYEERVLSGRRGGYCEILNVVCGMPVARHSANAETGYQPL